MNKLKKAMVTLGLAATLAVTGTGVAQVATATPEFGNSAQAYTITKIEKWQWNYFYGSNGRKYCSVNEYRIHNWWEKFVEGKRDGWHFVYWAWC